MSLKFGRENVIWRHFGALRVLGAKLDVFFWFFSVFVSHLYRMGSVKKVLHWEPTKSNTVRNWSLPNRRGHTVKSRDIESSKKVGKMQGNKLSPQGWPIIKGWRVFSEKKSSVHIYGTRFQKHELQSQNWTLITGLDPLMCPNLPTLSSEDIVDSRHVFASLKLRHVPSRPNKNPTGQLFMLIIWKRYKKCCTTCRKWEIFFIDNFFGYFAYFWHWLGEKMRHETAENFGFYAKQLTVWRMVFHGMVFVVWANFK